MRTLGVNAYRDREMTIDVLKIEFFDGPTHRVWGTTTHSFGISFGVYLKFAPNPFGGGMATDRTGNLQPDETVCALRSHLLRTLRQSKNVPPNVWSVDAELSNLDAVTDDVIQVAQKVAASWFDRIKTPTEILELLRSADEVMDGGSPCFGFGRKGSPLRNLHLGFAALQSGQRDLARDALTAAMSKGGFAQLSGSPEVDDEIRKTLSELAR